MSDGPCPDKAVRHATPQPRILQRITVPASKEFMNPSGDPVLIPLCGDLSYEGLRFVVDDKFAEDLSGIDVETAIVNNETSRVVDFRNALRLFSQFDLQGCHIAGAIMEWCSKTLFSIQYGSGA